MNANDSARGFVWSSGSWFGPVFGSTCWILLAGLSLVPAGPWTAAPLVALYGLMIAFGVALWRRRDVVSYHRAIQIHTWLAGGASIAALLLLTRSGGFEETYGRTPSELTWILIILAITVFLSFVFWRRQRSA